jgi:hypothetical protein
VVNQARLIPSGAHNASVWNGFSPFASACGHHPNDHMKMNGSRPKPMYSSRGSGSTRMPK